MEPTFSSCAKHIQPYRPDKVDKHVSNNETDGLLTIRCPWFGTVFLLLLADHCLLFIHIVQCCCTGAKAMIAPVLEKQPWRIWVNSINTNSTRLKLQRWCMPLCSAKPPYWRISRENGSHNTMRPRQNGRHFPDYIFKWIFCNENAWISIKISL